MRQSTDCNAYDCTIYITDINRYDFKAGTPMLDLVNKEYGICADYPVDSWEYVCPVKEETLLQRRNSDYVLIYKLSDSGQWVPQYIDYRKLNIQIPPSMPNDPKICAFPYIKIIVK